MFDGSVEENNASSKLNRIIKKELESNFKKIDDDLCIDLYFAYLDSSYNQLIVSNDVLEVIFRFKNA